MTIKRRFQQDEKYRTTVLKQGYTEETMGELDEMAEAISRFDEMREEDVQWAILSTADGKPRPLARATREVRNIAGRKEATWDRGIA